MSSLSKEGNKKCCLPCRRVGVESKWVVVVVKVGERKERVQKKIKEKKREEKEDKL